MILSLFSLLIASHTPSAHAQAPTTQDKETCDAALVEKWNNQYWKDFQIHREMVGDDNEVVELNECPSDALAEKMVADAYAPVSKYYNDNGLAITNDVTLGIRARVNRVIKIMEREVILARTLWNLEHLTFRNSPIPGETTPDFYQMAMANLPSTYYRPEEDQLSGICSGDSIAHTAPSTDKEPNRLTLCDDFYSVRTNPFVRAMTLVHEGRHRSRNDPNHVQCREGSPYYSKDFLNLGCDQRLEFDITNKGSGYNASVYFMYWIIHYNQYRNLPGDIFRPTLAKVYMQDAIRNRFLEKISDEQYQKYGITKP